jgi:hypothetical protein
MQFSNAEGQMDLMRCIGGFQNMAPTKNNLGKNKKNILVKYQYSITRCVKIQFQTTASLVKRLYAGVDK